MSVATKAPEEWLRYITNERKTYNGPNKYKYWLQLYRRAADSIPANEYAHNNNAYAKIMVDFAKLQARTSEDDARNIFQAARSNVKHCSLVYVAWAQFELLNNNPKKCKKLLEKGKEYCAEPRYLLDVALQNFNSGNHQLIDDETEEHTFTELINKNTSKTEDFNDYTFRTKQRTSDSSIESTSSSVGAFSPESVHLTAESSEEGDDVTGPGKPLRSTNLSSIEECRVMVENVLDFPENAKVLGTSTKTNSDSTIAPEPNAKDPLNSYWNDNARIKQSDPTKSTMSTPSLAKTIKPISNNVPKSLVQSQNTTKKESNAPKCPTNVNCNDTTFEANKENMGDSNFVIPTSSSTRKKGRSSGSSESSDDFDALSWRRSLLNIGKKTGLMDFVTPQNKNSAKVAATGTENKTAGSSFIKERRLNIRAKRSVCIGLPRRVPKRATPESDEEDAEEKNESEGNGKKIESRIETKVEDNIDGVFVFPKDGNNFHPAHVDVFQVSKAANIKKIDSMSTIGSISEEPNFRIYNDSDVPSVAKVSNCTQSSFSSASKVADNSDSVPKQNVEEYGVKHGTNSEDFKPRQNIPVSRSTATLDQNIVADSNLIAPETGPTLSNSIQPVSIASSGLQKQIPLPSSDAYAVKSSLTPRDQDSNLTAPDNGSTFRNSAQAVAVPGLKQRVPLSKNDAYTVKSLSNVVPSVQPTLSNPTEPGTKKSEIRLTVCPSGSTSESEYNVPSTKNNTNTIESGQAKYLPASKQGVGQKGAITSLRNGQGLPDDLPALLQNVQPFDKCAAKEKVPVVPMPVTKHSKPQTQGVSFTNQPVSNGKFNPLQRSAKVKRVNQGEGYIHAGQQANQVITPNFQSSHGSVRPNSVSKSNSCSNPNLSSHNPGYTPINASKRPGGPPEMHSVNPSFAGTGKSKQASSTVHSGSISNSSHSRNSGCLLDSSISGLQAGMPDISRIPGQYSGPSRNITVNGKVYSKLNMIGRGGSSEVFTVFDADYSQYALKYVNVRDADASVFQSYVNEITLLKRLQGHESIIRLYDWEMDEVNKVIKIVLERGSTDLAGYLKKNPGKITTEFIKMCWRKMLDAVDVVHKEGIIHSDLKPANFLLVEWNLKLIDFGIANAIQGDVTSFYRDSTIGTLSYMSPEALKDVSMSHDPNEQHKPLMKIGRPSDVWSLGCILYLMAYGKTPFQHIKNNFQKWSCIIDPSYEIKFPNIENQDLLDSMKGCLRRNPSERYTIPQLQDHPFLTGRTSANDVDNVLNYIMQMQEINSPRTLKTFAKNLVGHLSSGSSLNLAQKFKGE